MVAVEVVEQSLLDQLQQQLHATELHVNWQLEQLQQHLQQQQPLTNLSQSQYSMRKSAEAAYKIHCPLCSFVSFPISDIQPDSFCNSYCRFGWPYLL